MGLKKYRNSRFFPRLLLFFSLYVIITDMEKTQFSEKLGVWLPAKAVIKGRIRENAFKGI